MQCKKEEKAQKAATRKAKQHEKVSFTGKQVTTQTGSKQQKESNKLHYT